MSPAATESAITDAGMSQLAALVECSGDAIIGLTLAGTITSWNRGATALYGYSADEAVNRPIDILLAHDRDHASPHVFLPITHGETYERVDAVHTSKDGEAHDVSLTISAVREPEGRLIGMSVIARDVSTQKRAEEHLWRQSRYFELSRDMVCTAGLDGYFKQLNGMWTETLGWSDIELRSRPMLAFIHPDDHQATLDERERLPQTGTTVAFVNRYATKDGGWRWIDWNTRFDAEEQLVYATARDITGRMEAEAQAQFQSQLLDAVGEAVITTDLTGAITYWGPGAEKLYGWSARETVGRSIMDVIPAVPGPDPAQVAETMSRLAKGEPYTGIMRLGRRDGSTFLAEITDTPVLDGEGRMVAIIGISSDVSEREDAAEAVKLARDQALEASVLKSHFLANMSHEIRTPMNGVLGMTELLLDTALDARQREYAETVRSSGDALLAIIDDILDLSKIEAGRMEFEVIPFDLPTVVEEIAELLAGAAHAKGLELVVDVAANIPSLCGDPGRLRQVLANLLGNAVKFTSSGRVVVSARVVGVTDAGTTVRLEVDDTGIGISPEAISKIFEPFAQADSSTNRQYGGTGLGLTITRQLVDLMDGDFGVDSLAGAGSSFWFRVTLPRSEIPADPPLSLQGMKALVVDDDATNRLVLRRYLAGHGIEVDVAGSGAAARESARAAAATEAPFSVVVSAMNMHGVNGLELATALGSDPGTEGTPIILLSSSGDTPPGSSRPAGIVAIMAKPVRRKRLIRCLGEIAAPTTAVAAPPPIATPPREGKTHGGRVLLAEDNLINQRVAVAMLGSAGYTVDVAPNGREAVSAMQARRYEVVLMDCQMPEMDGYEAAAAIRASEGTGRRTPIIAMTAGAMQEDRDRARAAGMDDFLAKPVRKSDVLSAVARWVGAPAATR